MTVALKKPPTTHVRRHSLAPRTFVSDGAPCTDQSRVETPVTITGISRPVPSLPVELHFEIIDTVACRVPRTPCRDEPYDPADLDTLCACALVCKLWLNTARMWIWEGVRLSGRKKSMAFVRLLRAYTRETGDRLPTLTMPSVGRYVRHLSMPETRGNAWDPKWLDDALPCLATHLCHVQSLEMERVAWEHLSSGSRTACLQAFKQAKSLALRGFVFRTSRDMYHFLGEFADVEALTLDGVHWRKKNTPTRVFDFAADGERRVYPPPAKLREVGFRDVAMEPVLEWIMAGYEYQRKAGKAGPRIKSIRMGGVGMSEASVVGRFLRVAGDSLRRVYIGFETDFVGSGDALVEDMALGENTNLEEFHIFGLVVPSPPPVDPFEQEAGPPERVLEALTRLLSQIRSRMRVLSIALYPADVRAMSAVDFGGLAGVFETGVWSEVDEVRVVVANRGDYELCRVVKERLRALHERGVLKVAVGFDEREVL